MWNCNSSASPACPARRVLPIVTQWAAADEMGTTFSGLFMTPIRVAPPGGERSAGRAAG